MEFQMPRPTPEHEALKQLSGSWRGVETMMPSAWSPERQERHGRIDARVLEGFFVVSEYEQRTGD